MSYSPEVFSVKNIIKKSIEKTGKAREFKIEKKISKHNKVYNNEIPDFSLQPCDSLQIRNKSVTVYTVRAWLREGVEKRIGWSVTLPPLQEWWQGKQFKVASMLLKSYDSDLLKKAIFYLCDNWEQMVKDSNGKLSGLPTVELLWVSRERIFPSVEMGIPYKSPSKKSFRNNNNVLDAGEFKDPGNVGHGW